MNTLIRIVYEVNGEIFKASSLETEHFSIKTQSDGDFFSAHIKYLVIL